MWSLGAKFGLKNIQGKAAGSGARALPPALPFTITKGEMEDSCRSFFLLPGF